MIIAAKFALLSLVSAALHLPVRKVYHNKDSVLAKRSTWGSDIHGNGLSYLADIEVGTPPQKETVIVDTGSSDLWFATPQVCNTNAQGVAPANATYVVDCNNVFDVTKSSSIVNTTIPFAIGYGDGSSSNGYYIKDTVSIAGTTIENANCAYAYSASAPSIMGIGFPLNEACVDFHKTKNGSYIVSSEGCAPYDNIPQQFKTQGKISSTAYSIWLNDLSAYDGNILFGGVDHAKYIGDLVSLPIEAEPVGYSIVDGSVLGHLPDFTRTLVTLNQVKLMNDKGESDVLLEGAIPILLDTGSTECSLPSALVNSLASAFNALPDGQGGWFLNCGVTETAYIAFNFRGLEIQVPFRQFVRPFTDNYGDMLIEGSNGIDYCYFGASADDGDTFPILGDNVLSSFYAVFDLEKGEIALAPAIYNQDETDIEDIVDSIPRAVQAPAYSYSFSSHLEINPSPTLSFTLEPVTSVYHQTGTVVEAELTATSQGDDEKARATANFVNIANIHEKPVYDANATSTSQVYINTYGMTNIISLGEGLGLPEGVSTVYSAGPPSTLGLPLASSTGSASANGTTSASASTPVSSSPFNTTSIPQSSQGYMATTTDNGSATGAFNNVTNSPSATVTSVGGSGATTVTSDVTILTTYCPGPTTFTYGSSAFTVTEATTLTITICDAPHISIATAPGPVVHSAATVTDIKTVLTTYCPGATVFTYGSSTYTVTEATTLTITSCPADETTVPSTTSVEESTLPTSALAIESSYSVDIPVGSSTGPAPSVSSGVPTEITAGDMPNTIASNGASKISMYTALLFGALL